MARHDVDPVLQQLVRAINESGQAALPVTVSVHGTALTGALISQRRYFSELVEGKPMMSALEPSSGLLGKEYAKDAARARCSCGSPSLPIAPCGASSSSPAFIACWPSTRPSPRR